METHVGHRVMMLLENNPYPQDVRVRREAEALDEAGYRVSVICPRAPGQRWRARLNGVRVYRFPPPPRANGLVGYAWEYGYSMAAMFLLSLVVWLREGFDTIHAHNPPDTLILVAAPYKLLGRRIVFDHHDLAPELYLARFEGSGNKLVHSALILFERLSCQLADHIVCTNESYKAVEMQRGRVPEHRITIVRNGSEPCSSKRGAALDGLTKDGTKIVGYAGVMGFQDGVDHLMRVLQHLVYDLGRADVLCVLVGAGDAMQSSKSLAEELGLADHVLFTGWVDQGEVAVYLDLADVCVAPEPSNSYNDRSTMIKLMEYMAIGKPIVAFDLPEHRRTARSAAAYVRPNDEFEFARSLSSLLDDPARREAMGFFGRRRIETKLAWSYSVPHLLAAYRKLGCVPPEESCRSPD
jgi:glycosyltransferase involved in cell wall biosynthesis